MKFLTIYVAIISLLVTGCSTTSTKTSVAEPASTSKITAIKTPVARPLMSPDDQELKKHKLRKLVYSSQAPVRFDHGVIVWNKDLKKTTVYGKDRTEIMFFDTDSEGTPLRYKSSGLPMFSFDSGYFLKMSRSQTKIISDSVRHNVLSLFLKEPVLSVQR